MGLFSSSKSKSTSKVYTTTQNAGFQEVAGPAASNQGSDTNNITGAGNIGFRGSSNTVQVLDGGAINRAFEFAELSSGNAAAAVKESVAAVTESARAETENVANQIKTVAIYLGIAFAGYKAIQAWSKSK